MSTLTLPQALQELAALEQPCPRHNTSFGTRMVCTDCQGTGLAPVLDPTLMRAECGHWAKSLSAGGPPEHFPGRGFGGDLCPGWVVAPDADRNLPEALKRAGWGASIAWQQKRFFATLHYYENLPYGAYHASAEGSTLAFALALAALKALKGEGP